MLRNPIRSVEDLRVYQLLFELALEVSTVSLTFPKFELYELGSQVRRSSNSAPAQLSEGWGNRHIKMYLEGVTRALAEVRETRHHLRIARRKGYFSDEVEKAILGKYEECRLMLQSLEQSFLRKLGNE